jgi:hypothetical protein
MTMLYRPTLHQVCIFDWAEDEARARLLGQAAVEHLAAALTPADATELRGQTDRVRSYTFTRDARYPLVRSQRLYPVAGQPQMCAAVLLYQEGSSLVAHLMWQIDQYSLPIAAFPSLAKQVWQVPPEAGPISIDQGLLVTAVLPPGEPGSADMAQEFARMVWPQEQIFVPIQLNGGILYAARRPAFESATWPAVLLFADPQAEANPGADQFATVDWPLMVLYHTRLAGAYTRVYRRLIYPALEQTMASLRVQLGIYVGAATALRRTRREVRQAVHHISKAHMTLLAELALAERCASEGQRNLDNLLEQVRAIQASPIAENLPRHQDSLDGLSSSGSHFVAQMKSDVLAAQGLAAQSTAALELLNTESNLVESNHQRLLNFVVFMVGTGLTVGQVVDSEMARALYLNTFLGELWQNALGGAPLGQGDDALSLSFIRFLMILLGLAFGALLAGIVTRFTGHE